MHKRCRLRLARERKTLHAAIFDAMQALHTVDREAHLAELAWHAHAAQRWDQALDYSRRAAEQAHRLFAPRAVIEHYTRALEAADSIWHVPITKLRCAKPNQTTTRAQNGRTCSASASCGRRAICPPRVIIYSGRCKPRAMNDPATLGHSLNRVGNWLLNMDQPALALHDHQEALRIFEQLGDKAGLAATHDLLGITHTLRTDYVAYLPHHAHAAALFRELDDWHGLISTLAISSNHGGNYQSDTSVFAPESVNACRASGDEAIRLSQQIGWRFGEAMSHMFPGAAMGTRGAYA